VVGYDQSADGINMSGVVMIVSSGIGGCTGSLLGDGTSILTAGHCVSSSYGGFVSPDITVYFQGPNGFIAYTAASVSVDPQWNGTSTDGGDLAVIHLAQLAPAFATRYDLDPLPVGTGPEVLAGYGYGGTGTGGYNTSLYDSLRVGENEYVYNGIALGWSSTMLVGQFYENGVSSTNALHASNPYSAVDEVDIAPGDSGGPTFYDGEIVGVHDVSACVTNTQNSSECAVPPALSTTNNSSFGDLFGDTGVNSNLSWIEDQEAPEPRTLSMMVGAIMAALLLRNLKAKPETAKIAERAGRISTRQSRG
jgi:V8-like Glu-specific endopeptidase